MNFKELPVPNQESMRAYTRELIELARHEVRETKATILGYVFVVNGGALVAAIAYVATKPSPEAGAIAAIVLFGIGLGCAMLRAVIDYYGCEAYIAKLMNHVKQFYGNGMSMEAFLAERDKPHPKQWPYHLLGWLAAICFFVGLTVGVVAISK